MITLIIMGLIVVQIAMFVYVCDVHDRLRRTEEGLSAIGSKYDLWN